jgi:predicted transcriptional regulator
MEIIWDKGEVGVLEVTEMLNQIRPIARNTVRTLMERMQEKGWLTYRPQGRSYIYSALVPREESLGQRVTEMVDKACGGEPERLMMALLNYRGLSDEETHRIQKMLDEAKAKQDKRK